MGKANLVAKKSRGKRGGWTKFKKPGGRDRICGKKRPAASHGRSEGGEQDLFGGTNRRGGAREKHPAFLKASVPGRRDQPKCGNEDPNQKRPASRKRGYQKRPLRKGGSRPVYTESMA